MESARDWAIEAGRAHVAWRLVVKEDVASQNDEKRPRDCDSVKPDAETHAQPAWEKRVQDGMDELSKTAKEAVRNAVSKGEIQSEAGHVIAVKAQEVVDAVKDARSVPAEVLVARELDLASRVAAKPNKRCRVKQRCQEAESAYWKSMLGYQDNFVSGEGERIVNDS